VTRTGDRKSKSGVVLLRQISGDDGLLSSKPKKFMLKVDRSTLGILSKDGKTMHKSYPIERCKFKGGAAGEIDAIAPGVRFAIKDKDAKSWLLALQTNSSKMNLTGTSPVAHEGAKRKDSLGFVLNEPPKPHLANRKAMEITVTKAKGSSMGMKVCGGGGPGGDPNRPEIFVFSLEKDGLADRAGLARGDIVISVGKTALTGMVVSAAAKELSKAGGDVMLRILRKVKKHHARENAEPAAAAGVGKFFGEEAGPPDLPAADASTKSKTERRRSKEKAPAKEKPSKKKEKKEKEKKEKKKRSSKKGAATDGPAVANGAAGAAAEHETETETEEHHSQYERRLRSVALTAIEAAESRLRKARAAAASDPAAVGGVAGAFRDAVIALQAGRSRLEQTARAHARKERTRAAQREQRGPGPSHRHRSHTGTREKVPKPKERDTRERRRTDVAEAERKRCTLCPHIKKPGGCQPRGVVPCRFAHSLGERDHNRATRASASAADKGRRGKRPQPRAPRGSAPRPSKRRRGHGGAL